MFIGLFAVQLSLSFLSPSSSSFSTSPNMQVVLKNYNGTTCIAVTMLFVCIVSFLMTIKTFRYRDFTFVTNRLSSSLSTIGFLLTLSAFGGISASLYCMPIRLIAYFFEGPSNVSANGFTVPPLYLMTGILAAVLYCILASGLGFLIGSLFQNQMALIFSFALVVILSASIISLRPYVPLFAALSSFLDHHLLGFFSGESSLWLFAGKVLLTSAVLYALGALLTSRLEVKR